MTKRQLMRRNEQIREMAAWLRSQAPAAPEAIAVKRRFESAAGMLEEATVFVELALADMIDPFTGGGPFSKNPARDL